MSYVYEDLRPRLFTEQGSVLLLATKAKAESLVAIAGAVRMHELLEAVLRVGTMGDNWTMIAAVDRLVEMGELREVTPPGAVAGQDRVFVRDSAVGW